VRWCALLARDTVPAALAHTPLHARLPIAIRYAQPSSTSRFLIIHRYVAALPAMPRGSSSPHPLRLRSRDLPRVLLPLASASKTRTTHVVYVHLVPRTLLPLLRLPPVSVRRSFSTCRTGAEPRLYRARSARLLPLARGFLACTDAFGNSSFIFTCVPRERCHLCCYTTLRLLRERLVPLTPSLPRTGTRNEPLVVTADTRASNLSL